MGDSKNNRNISRILSLCSGIKNVLEMHRSGIVDKSAFEAAVKNGINEIVEISNKVLQKERIKKEKRIKR